MDGMLLDLFTKVTFFLGSNCQKDNWVYMKKKEESIIKQVTIKQVYFWRQENR